MSDKKRWIVGISGASGSRYALRLLDKLESLTEVEIHLVVTESALTVLNQEEGIKVSASSLSAELLIGRQSQKIITHNPRDIASSIASGSFVTEGMVVIPCSMDTLASIASGVQGHLLHRAADVVIKEGRKLILVPRETPLSAIHLENMLKLARIGVAIAPAMPGFYHKPKTVEDLIDMQIMKVLDLMRIENQLVRRWS